MNYHLYRCTVLYNLILSENCRLKSAKNSILAVSFLIGAGKEARIHSLEVLKLVDVRECFQRRIELPELFYRHIAGVDATNHRAKGKGLVILQVTQKHRPPVYCMEWLDHVIIPGGYDSICIAYGIEKIAYYSRIDAGHIARGDKQRVAMCCQCSCMQPADRANTRADVGDAPDIIKVTEALALFRILCHKYYLINNLFESADEPLNEGPALINEEVLLLPVRTPGFPTYENHR